LPILDSSPHLIKGMAHITGGGLIENLPRILPDGLGAQIETETWSKPAIFAAIQEIGQIEHREMFRVFNMGIGFAIVVAQSRVSELAEQLIRVGENPIRIGTIVRDNGVTLM
jgi:phosphoribosylformylglycinamidine cyclo-ligase